MQLTADKQKHIFKLHESRDKKFCGVPTESIVFSHLTQDIRGIRSRVFNTIVLHMEKSHWRLRK